MFVSPIIVLLLRCVSGWKTAVIGFVLLTGWIKHAVAQDTWSFMPDRDTFDQAAILDLSDLNEEVAGQSGWIKTTEDGGFVLGDGQPVRFWAVGTSVNEAPARSQVGWGQQFLDHQAKWFAKRGVNMVRVHAFINPAPSDPIDSVDEEEVEWIWRVVSEMKDEGIYTTLSPYWGVNMASNDANWGTDWQGVHLGLLFFDETLKSAYKAWLRYLFTTPTEHLGGKTLAEEPALGIFQVQNEDSLLFWTINNLPPGPKARMGKLFGDFAIEKYGSLDAAFEVWGTAFSEGDDLENGILGLANIWYLTGDAPPSESKRLSDLHQFWTELMYDFYAEIVDYVRNDLGCPVVTNATNWKTADTVLLNDSERYSYLPTEVMAVNRYFTGVHSGPNQGWAIISGDFYTNASVLIDKAFELPVNLKQVAGRPMMVTESTWVYPNEYGFEAPLLLASYMSLTGVDMYFWFSSGTDDFEIPRSANGYLAFSQAKWLCMTPDMAGQWPAAALAFRRGYIRQGQPVVQEHRALQSMWDRRSPVIAESPSFDPNRDSGNLPPESSVETGVTPWAFFVGPVQVTYNSSEANTRVAEDMDDYISDSGSGKIVRSNTGELELNTDAKLFRLDSPRVQGVVSHRPGQVSLSNVAVDSGNGGFAVTVVSLDGLPLAGSRKVLVQVGTHSRPTGWATTPEIREISGTMMEGFVVDSVGSAPWAVQSADLNLAFAGMSIQSATTLDMNGIPREALALDQDNGSTRLQFPLNAMYVVLEGNGLDYQTWAASVAWDNPDNDMLDLAVPERDGIPNLMEYAFSGDPLVADFHLLPQLELVQDGETSRYALEYRRSNVPGDLELRVESSPDLAGWEAWIDGENEVQETLVDADVDGDGSTRLIRLTIPVDKLASPTPLFVRLRVTRQ